MQLGMDVGGEVVCSLGGGFSLGLGAGYFRMMRESTFGYDWMTFSAQQTIAPRITAVPLVLNLHRDVSLGGPFRLDLYAGAGYYLTTLRQEFRTSTNFFEFAESQTFQARKGAFGGQGGILAQEARHLGHHVVGHGDVRNGMLEDDLVVISPANMDGVAVEPHHLAHELLPAYQEEGDESPLLADEV